MDLNILIVDNYDSFTFNLAHQVARLGAKVEVKDPQSLNLDQQKILQYSAIVLGPGPGQPTTNRSSLEILKLYCDKLPMLGVCLGMQAMAEFFGGHIIRAPQPIHGKTSCIEADTNSLLFKDCPAQFNVARYHSLTVQREVALEKMFKITARSLDDGLIMAIEHHELLLLGVQFHPESFLTEQGDVMLKNFLTAVYNKRGKNAG